MEIKKAKIHNLVLDEGKVKQLDKNDMMKKLKEHIKSKYGDYEIHDTKYLKNKDGVMKKLIILFEEVRNE